MPKNHCRTPTWRSREISEDLDPQRGQARPDPTGGRLRRRRASALSSQLLPPPRPLPQRHVSFSLIQTPIFSFFKKVIEEMGTAALHSVTLSPMLGPHLQLPRHGSREQHAGCRVPALMSLNGPVSFSSPHFSLLAYGQERRKENFEPSLRLCPACCFLLNMRP